MIKHNGDYFINCTVIRIKISTSLFIPFIRAKADKTYSGFHTQSEISYSRGITSITFI